MDLRPRLVGEFALSAESASNAVNSAGSFNAIHVDSAYKFDFFQIPNDPYYAQELDLFQKARLDIDGKSIEFPIVSPGDSILTKLVWYRRGGHVSERQVNDVKGIVALVGDNLDRVHLRRWEPHLGVQNLVDELT